MGIKARLLLGLTIVLLCTVTMPVARVQVGVVEGRDIQTPHPYFAAAERGGIAWSRVVEEPGAHFLKLHVAELRIPGGDSIEIVDGEGVVRHRLEGTRQDFWIPSVLGGRVEIRLRSSSGLSDFGLQIDRVGIGTAPLDPEDTCGVDDKEHIACVNGSIPFDRGAAVGRMLFADGGSLFNCTGSLVDSNDHFMSNQHCISSQANVDSLEVRFNFQSTDCAGTNAAPFQTFTGNQFILARANLDMSLMTLNGNPSATFGFLPLEGRPLNDTEPLYVVQHPNGNPKRIDRSADCQVTDPSVSFAGNDVAFAHQCDTQPGSSGSPVFDADHDMVGLHRAGALDDLCPPNSNSAVQLRFILPEVCPSIDNPGCDGCVVEATIAPRSGRAGDLMTFTLHALHRERYTDHAELAWQIFDDSGQPVTRRFRKNHDFDYLEERFLEKTFQVPERLVPGRYWIELRLTAMQQGTVSRRVAFQVLPAEDAP